MPASMSVRAGNADNSSTCINGVRGGLPVPAGATPTRIVDISPVQVDELTIMVTNTGANPLAAFQVYVGAGPQVSGDSTTGNLVCRYKITCPEIRPAGFPIERLPPGESGIVTVPTAGLHQVSLFLASSAGTSVVVEACAPTHNTH